MTTPEPVPVFRVVDVNDEFELAKLLSLMGLMVNGGRALYSVRLGIDTEGFKISVNYKTWSPPIKGKDE
jgi:hypothetical protein